MEEKSTIEQMAELLLRSSLSDVERKINERIETSFTACEAKLDGIKTELNSKIKEIEAIATDKPLQINFGTVEQPETKLVHTQFMKVLNILKSQKRIQKNIMLVGEAGSGKTHLAYNVSQALGLKFYPMSVGLQTTKSDLLGFVNAHGSYITSPIREAFEKGGVLLLDEFDSAHAGVVTIINSLLANGHCSFPDKIVEKNDNFICIVACNTYGHGANIDYVGRNRLDGATLDRFIVVDVGYDKSLEDLLTHNTKWLEIIEQIRKNIEEQGIKMIVSPRASMNGADLLEQGFSIEEVLDMCVFKGTDYDTKTKCLRGINFQEQKPVAEGTYTRDTVNAQVWEIRTEDESFKQLKSIQAINEKLIGNDMNVDVDGYSIRFGNWSYQFTSSDEMFFKSTDTGTRNLSPYESDLIERFLGYIANGNYTTRNFQCPIVFEFVKTKCRKPWATIRIEEKE